MSELLFSVVTGGLEIFSMVFCLGFRFMVWRLAPETVQKILFMSGLLFWVRFLFLRFPVGVVFVFFTWFGILSRDLFAVSCLCLSFFLFLLLFFSFSLLLFFLLGAGPGLLSSFLLFALAGVRRRQAGAA